MTCTSTLAAGARTGAVHVTTPLATVHAPDVVVAATPRQCRGQLHAHAHSCPAERTIIHCVQIEARRHADCPLSGVPLTGTA